MHDGNAILGIFLATYSSKGDYLPLRYPLSRADYEYAAGLLSGGTARGAAHAGGAEPYLARLVHGFEPKFLAQLFSPRPSMSDRRFQVAIDNVLFVGHPLRDDPKEKTRDPDYYDAEQDDSETMSRLAEYEGWKIKSDSMAQPAANQRTRLLADLGLMSLMLNREPSETGDSAISDGERAVRESSEWRRRGYWKRVYPKLFHVVFMLDNTVAGIERLADRIYEHVLKRLTKTLMIEQMESNYVLTQSRIIRSLNDLALAERYTPAQYLQEVLRRSQLATDLISLYNGLCEGRVVTLHIHKRIMLSLQIPRGPGLARPLLPGATLADGAAGRSVAAAVQDYEGPMAFSLGACSAGRHEGPQAAGERPDAIVTGRELQAGERDVFPQIEPFHALLLLEDAAGVRRRLACTDASPTLLALVERATPARSLAVLHAMVDCSFAQVCRFAAHLVYWNIARLICPVNLAFTYVPTAAALSRGLADAFGARGYTLCTLPQLLAQMHPPRPAIQVLDALITAATAAGEDGPGAESGGGGGRQSPRAEIFDMIVFLLREGAVAQYHTWPVVLVPSYVKHDLSEDQFVQLALAWFRMLQAEHPDLLGAFPQALLDEGELACWAADESHEQGAMELVQQIAREAETRVMLCRTMRKLALRRMREAWSARHQGKQGRELQRAERQAEAEEDRIHAFCNRIEKESMQQWMQAKAQCKTALAQARQRRVQGRRAQGRGDAAADPDAADPGAADPGAAGRESLHAWYSFVKRDPDFGDFAREIVRRHVDYAPTDAPPHRTNAEKKYIRRLVRTRPSTQQDWFHRYSHLFTGANHLVKLADSEQIPVGRLEMMLREFDGVIHLPQHV
ncbi:Nitrogen permease regulator 3 [Coemansia javaensis]|uniref:Nitrogen permease regulator 3 n=1 Tax=Coemansia javaensis TaxID=2761396 RepID=A0A9W8HCK7_9FUNG|nr:Nitrogen permease regulator 3 [Coemansia javaensis]